MTNVACPNCGNFSLSSNKFEDVEFARVAGDAFTATRSGRTADAVSSVIAWAGLKLANAVRKPHKCGNCQHSF